MTNQLLPTSDPGWGEAFRRSWLSLLLPWRVPKGMDGLTALRSRFLSMAEAILPIIVVIQFIAIDWNAAPTTETTLWAAIVAAIGFLDFGLVLWVKRRPLTKIIKEPGMDETKAIATAYMAPVMLGAAFSMTSFLMGFVATFITERSWMIFVGLPFALICFWISAPTRSNLETRQQELDSSGSQISIVQAVMQHPQPWRDAAGPRRA